MKNIILIFVMLFSMSSNSFADDSTFYGNQVPLFPIGVYMPTTITQWDQHMSGSYVRCLRMGLGLYTGTITYLITCGNQQYAEYLIPASIITKFSISYKSDASGSDTSACIFRLVDDSGNELEGSELEVQPTSVMPAGTEFSVNTSISMPQGSILQIQVKDGSASSCPAGTGCSCDQTIPNFQVGIFGSLL